MAGKWLSGSLLRGEDGQALALTAISMLALLGVAALAVDFGMLLTARSEAQRAADSIALAGASAFLGQAPGEFADEAKARSNAYAATNGVRDRLLDAAIVSEGPTTWESSEVSVDIDLTDLQVRATVRRAGIGLWFARALGINTAGIEATAVAEAAEAGSASCMVPFAIPEPENAQLGDSIMLKSTQDTSLVAGVDPFFAPFQMPEDSDVVPYCPRATGLEEEAWGRNPSKCSGPGCYDGDGRFDIHSFGGWHQATALDAWLAGEENPGDGNVYPADGYAENVCGENCNQVQEGEEYEIITGDMDGPTSWGVNARLAMDPNVEWDPIGNQLVRDDTQPITDWGSTPRVVKVPTFEMGQLTHSSDRTFEVNGFMYFFLLPGPDNGFYDPADQLAIMGRLLWFAEGEGPGTGPFVRVLRLIE